MKKVVLAVLAAAASPAARAAEPAANVGALTMETPPAARWSVPFAPVPAGGSGDRTFSDSFTRHDPIRTDADGPAWLRLVLNSDTDTPARRPAVAELPSVPYNFSPLIVAPAASSSASAFRLELLPAGNGGEGTNGSLASVNNAGFVPAPDSNGRAVPTGGWGAGTVNPAAIGAGEFAAPLAVGPQPQIVASGTYTGLADTTTAATGQSTAFSSFNTPVINGSNVAFYANYNVGSGQGIFSGTAGTQRAATIADTTTTATGQTMAFSSFNPPVISGSNVAFFAFYNANNSQGIFTGTAGTQRAATIADTTTTATGQTTIFSSFGNPVISGSNVAFLAFYNGNNGMGIFSGTAGVKGSATLADYTTTATGQTTVFSSFNPPVISGSNVVFLANYNAGNGQGVFTGTAGVKGATTIADLTTTATGQTTVFSSFNTPVISGSNVAFFAQYNGGRGIFTGTAGTQGAVTAADYTTTATGQSTVFSSFGNPAISGSNVAFFAQYNAGGGRGIFTGTAGVKGAATIADTTTTAPGRGRFTNFSMSPAISGGNVAFTATSYVSGSSGTTGNGIYLYEGGTLYDVAAVGEPLFGSTVSALGFTPTGLDGNNLTYSYTLTSGVNGVGTFTLAAVPEPATWAAGALTLAAAGCALRRRLRPAPHA